MPKETDSHRGGGGSGLGVDGFEYRTASPDDLISRWHKNILANPGDERWVRWKAENIDDNSQGECQTFVVVSEGVPIGEGTLILSPAQSAIGGRTELCDGRDVANINALRMDEEYRNQGHMSRLVKVMERYAKGAGYSSLTIGVEARETRNLAIYQHWGYTELIGTYMESGVLVLYYSKSLDS